MLDKIFKWNKVKPSLRPSIQFGRYSDNNKSDEKTSLWTDAEKLFKEKKYYESINCFFNYLRDDKLNNVVFQRNGTHFRFQIYQGSKVVRGAGNTKHLHAKVILAKMEKPSVPVMRRLLEHNYNLYYSRYSLNQDRLTMQFDSDIATSSPNKLYYALKELAITADKQDDLLVHDFVILEPLDTDHIENIPVAEKEVKYDFMQKWITHTLDTIKELEPEKYTGGISFLILALIYRIDYLLAPEGSLMHELESIQAIYFKKDDLPAVEKNRVMITRLEKLQQRPKELVFKNLFRSTSTFSIRQPKNYNNIIEAINNANKTMEWYRDNKYPHIAKQISEYGISFSQFSYSLPGALTEYFQFFMLVNYNDYFIALGFNENYSDPATKKLKREAIENEIEAVTRRWKNKYKQLNFPISKLKFDNIVEFNHSFTKTLTELNFETS